ncbi:50S ribosomal protein L4 [Candidatus Microgenomates bacterium]|nr:50S ribosomal protein L4 [Candidatus Microgenomates bacterium]
MKQIIIQPTPIKSGPTTGKTAAKLSLPDELFGQKPNDKLLAQAFYVYQDRQHKGTHKVKTRAEIVGTTAKMFRQKGTGRARHGMKKAPIFVGGGIAHGPTGLKRQLSLSKRLARQATTVALSEKLASKDLIVVKATALEGKTKTAQKWLDKLGLTKTKVLVLHGGEEKLARGLGNIASVELMPASQINAYQLIIYPKVVITEAGVELLKKTFLGQKENK